MTSTETTTAATITTPATPSLGSLLLHGVAAAAAASVATTLLAVAGRAAGVSLDLAGAPIPPTGFAVLTLIFSALGLVIAVGLRRLTARPRIAWLRTTVTLTALSLVPDVLADAAAGTKLLLMLTHVVAAAIVIPVVARRLS